MSVLKIKDANGDWQDIPAIKGADGAIQYTAGTNIQIANDTISTTALNQTQVQNLIDTSIQALGDLGFTPTVVQELPVSHIDIHTIYLVPKNGSTGDVYDEYLYINNNWEHIGSTEVDLSNYYTKTEVDNKISIPTITVLPAQMTSLTTCQFTAEQRALLDDDKYGIYYMVGHNIGLADGVIYKSRAYTENNVDYIDFASVYETSSIVKSLRGMYNKSTGVGTFSIHEILTTSNTTSYTPSGDYNPATKKYVDDALAGVGGDYPKVFYLYNDNKYEVPTSGTDTNATRMTQVSQFITDAINNNIRPQLIFVCNNTYVENLSDFGEREVCTYTMKTNPAQTTSYVFRSDEQWLNRWILGKASTFSTYGSGKYYQRYTLTINGSWSDNVFTATSISFGYENCNLNQMLPTVSTVLTRDNEDAYTPSGDYNPATKKYVDDGLASYTKVIYFDFSQGNTASYRESVCQEIYDAEKNGEDYIIIGYVGQSGFDHRRDSYTLGGLWTNGYDFSNATYVYFNYNYFGSSTSTNGLDAKYLVKRMLTFYVNNDVVYNTSYNNNYDGGCIIRSSGMDNIMSKANVTTYTPTSDYHPATKKYVDDAVAGAGGGSSMYLGALGDYTTDNRLDLSALDVGLYYLMKDGSGYGSCNFYLKAIKDDVTSTLDTNIYASNAVNGRTITLEILKKVEDVTGNENVAVINLVEMAGSSYYNIKQSSAYIYYNNNASTNKLYLSYTGNNNFNIVSIETAQTISGKKTFNTLPESSVTPTTNNQLTNKSYVDSAIASAITTTLGGSY